MEKIKSFLYSKKVTIGLTIIAILLGGIFAFSYFPKGKCYDVYALTYVPLSYDLSQIRFNKEAEKKSSCSTEGVRFVNGESIDWVLEEEHAEEGVRTHNFDLTHMNFVEKNGRKYTFVNDRNGNQALLGFIDNTFIYLNNENGQKLSKEDMIVMFDSLKKQ